MKLPYPKTFPTPDEEQFLKLVLCDDADFVDLWNIWKSKTIFDDINFATLRLIPLIYLRMQKLGLQNDDLFGRIKGVYKNAWVRNQCMITAATDFIKQCEIHNIPVILLKGLPMLMEVYSDIGARFSSDADILIKPVHGPRVTQLLLENGWHLKEHSSNRPASTYQVIRTNTFVNPYSIELDIHWNVYEMDFGTSLLDMFLLKPLPMIAFRETSWHDAVPMSIKDVSCMRLSNEDLLIHAIVHGSGRTEHRELRWVADAISIIKKLSIDWDKLICRSHDYGTIVDVMIAFSYLTERFNITVPYSFINTLHNIKLDPADVHRYYYTASTLKRYPWFGNLPLLWYAYWKFEPRKNLLQGLLGFIDYLCRSWGLENKRSLVSFAINKYKHRIFAQ